MRVFVLLSLLSLLHSLGSPDFRVREKSAMAWLSVAGSIMDPHPVLLWGQKHKDAEIAARCRVILLAHAKRKADEWEEKIAYAWPVLPWLDMLPLHYAERYPVIEFYLEQARDQIGRKGPPDWGDYSLATKLYIRQLFLAGKFQQVEPLLKTMAARQAEWIKENGKNYTPPLKVPEGW